MFDPLSLDTTLVGKSLCIAAATRLAQSEEEGEGYSRLAYDLVEYGSENRRQVKLGVSKAFLHLQRKVSLRWTNQQPSSFSFAALQWRCIPLADLANSRARDVWPDFAP